MNIEKLNPWNWFKHENSGSDNFDQVPVKRNENPGIRARSDAGSLVELHREFDRIFDNMLNTFGMPSLRSGFSEPRLFRDDIFNAYGLSNRPKVDISGDKNQYEISLDVPGLTSQDLSIEVQGDRLVISGQKEEESESKDKHFYRVERSVGSFQRTLALPDDANPDEISANLKDGVLLLSIPRRQLEGKDVKRIAISS